MEDLGVSMKNVYMVYEAIPVHENNPRLKVFPDYKKTNRRFLKEKNLSYKFAAYMKAQGANVCPSPGHMEADDMIAFLTRLNHSNKHKFSILTTDKDLLQLVDENVSLILFGKEGQIEKITEKNFSVRYPETKPWMIKYLKALSGDRADGYNGVIGIGYKKALSIIREFIISNDYSFDSVDQEIEQELIEYIENSLSDYSKKQEFRKCLYIAKLHPEKIKLDTD